METIIPKTETPNNIILTLIGIIIILGLILLPLIGSILWTLVILCVILGLTTQFYTEGSLPAFHALILKNYFTGQMRTVFPGLNLKFPWELPHEDGIDLRIELSEEGKETYVALDAQMEVKYVYTIRPNLKENDDITPGEKIILYSSFEPKTIKSKGKALFSMLISDYYGKNIGDNLLDKEKINKEIFGTEERPKETIKEFERRHGVEVTVRLEDSDFNERTQKYRDTISGAESMAKAINKFIESGMDRKEAEVYVKLMNTDGYSQKDLNLNVKAPDLKNLRDVTVLGGINDDSKKGGKK